MLPNAGWTVAGSVEPLQIDTRRSRFVVHSWQSVLGGNHA
jgi:hypothetical protein